MKISKWQVQTCSFFTTTAENLANNIAFIALNDNIVLIQVNEGENSKRQGKGIIL